MNVLGRTESPGSTSSDLQGYDLPCHLHSIKPFTFLRNPPARRNSAQTPFFPANQFRMEKTPKMMSPR